MVDLLKRFRLLLLLLMAVVAIILLAILIVISNTDSSVTIITVDLSVQDNYQLANPWAAIGTAAASLLSGIFGGHATSENNATQLKIARENNAFNANQARLNRDWQTQMLAEQNEFNYRMYNYAFDKEAAYNSPQAQMARLQASGINPFVAAGDVANVGNVSQSPPQAASAPSGATAQAASLPHTDPVNYLAGVPQMALQFAQAISALSQSKKTDKETQLLQSTMEDLIKQAHENLKGQQLQNKLQEIQNTFEPLVKKYHLQESYNNSLRLLSEKDLNLQKIQESFQNILNVAEQRAKTREERLTIEALRPKQLAQADELVKLYQEQQKTERATQYELGTRAKGNLASAQQAIAQGRYYDALRETEDALRNSKVSFADADQANKWSDFLFNVGSLKYRIDEEHWTADKVQKEVEKLGKELDNFAQGMIGEGINDLKRAFSDLGSALKKKVDDGTTFMRNNKRFTHGVTW